MNEFNIDVSKVDISCINLYSDDSYNRLLISRAYSNDYVLNMFKGDNIRILRTGSILGVALCREVDEGVLNG